MEDEDIYLSETVSFALHENLFVTYFPGLIKIGQVNRNGVFINHKTFTFHHSEYVKLYQGLVQMIQFFANASTLKGLIKQTENLNYYWSGFEGIRNGQPIKCIKIGLEIDAEIQFEFVCNENEFMNVIDLIKTNIILSLHLHSETLNIFHQLLCEKLEVILKVESDLQFATNYIKSKLKSKSQIKIQRIHEQLKYYSNILILTHKLNFFEENLKQEKNEERKVLLGLVVNE